MTTNQPAALPECIAHVEDWPDDRTPIGLVWDVDPASVPVGTKLYALQSQPAAAGVSDEFLYELWDQQYRSWIGGEQFEYIARAILALRPQAVPMTDEQLCAALDIDGSDDWTYKVRDVVEAHHGITAQGGEG